MIVLLDSGPLGMITNPRGNAEAKACQVWSKTMTTAGHLLLVPEIIDYEHRRELLLNNSLAAIARVDTFKENGVYLPVSEDGYLRAAQLFASARQQGLPTAGKEALDVDVILAAQAITFDREDWQRAMEEAIVIATSNLGHLMRFTHALLWTDIQPNNQP